MLTRTLRAEPEHYRSHAALTGEEKVKQSKLFDPVEYLNNPEAIKALLEEAAHLDAMKQALKFYADPQTWQLDGAAPISTAPIRADRGDRARSALNNLGVETGSAIEAPREMSGLSHDALKECVEALKEAVRMYENYALVAEPVEGFRPGKWIGDARSALAKLEKAS